MAGIVGAFGATEIAAVGFWSLLFYKIGTYKAPVSAHDKVADPSPVKPEASSPPQAVQSANHLINTYPALSRLYLSAVSQRSALDTLVAQPPRAAH